MTSTLALNEMNFMELTFDEMMVVDGGFDGDSFFTGLGIFGGAVIAIACAPVTAPVAAMCVGAAACGAASGYFMGKGLAN